MCVCVCTHTLIFLDGSSCHSYMALRHRAPFWESQIPDSLKRVPQLWHPCTTTRRLRPLCFFNRRMIVLQCCVHFCGTTAWISYKNTNIPSPWSLSPTSPLPSIWVITEHQAERPGSQSSSSPAISLTRGSVYVSVLLSVCAAFIPFFMHRLDCFWALISCSLILPTYLSYFPHHWHMHK